jgi:transposase
MAMGTRRKWARQEDLWVVRSEVVSGPASAFYDRLNQLLDQHQFDSKVEHLCRRYYKGGLGRPSITPGVYFRSLLLGYFEGIDSERGIAWRLSDSLSARRVIAYAATEETPDHFTLSRTRRLYSVETYKAVFRWVLKILAQEGLVEGKTVSVDATTLEAKERTAASESSVLPSPTTQASQSSNVWAIRLKRATRRVRAELYAAVMTDTIGDGIPHRLRGSSKSKGIKPFLRGRRYLSGLA